MASQWTSARGRYVSDMLANVSGGGRNGAAEAAKIRAQYAEYDPANPAFSWTGLADWAGSKGLRLIDPAFLGTLAQYGYTPQEVYRQASAKAPGWSESSNWWGDAAQKSALLESLPPKNGFDPGQFRASPAFDAEQKAVADEGAELQAKNKADVVGDFIVPAAAIALGVGFASSLGAAGAATAEAGATAAGDAGFLTAGGVTTPSTGGIFVGNSGMLGGTGNAIADAALNGAVRGGVTSALTGGDPITGALSGGVSGGVGSLIPDLGNPALNNAARGAVSGGVGAAVNGGDILTGAAAGGAAGGVGTLVRDAVGTELGGNTLANAAAGGAAGAVGSAIAGGDVTTGLIRGAVTGGVSGAATDLGADPAVAGAAGTLAGGLINSPTPDAGTPPAQQQQTSNEITSGLGFSVVLPQFQNTPRRDMQWGTRLNGG